MSKDFTPLKDIEELNYAEFYIPEQYELGEAIVRIEAMLQTLMYKMNQLIVTLQNTIPEKKNEKKF